MSLDLGEFVREFAFRVPDVKGSLQVEPKFGSIAAKLAEPNRHRGRDGNVGAENSVQRLSTDAEVLDGLSHGNIERGQHVFAK